MSQVRYTNKTLTPAYAQKLLAKQIRNRPVSAKKVTQYATDIANGLWLDSGETIKLDTRGLMFDGQHRCHAVIQADKPIRVCVASNLDVGAFKVVDTGKIRSKADALHVSGEKSCNILASAALLSWKYRNDLMGQDGSPDNSKVLTNAGVLDYVRKNRRLREVIKRTMALYAKRRILAEGPMAFLYYEFSVVKPRKAEQFFTQLVEGYNLKRGNPIYTLRERLSRIKEQNKSGKRYRTNAICAMVIKAWNAWLGNEKMFRLYYSQEQEFPEIDG